MPRLSLDTNVLVYAVDKNAGEKNDIAVRMVRCLAQDGGVLTQQVIGEFLNVSRRMPHLNQRRLRRIAVGLTAVFPILATEKDLLFEAFDRSIRNQLQFWDSVIIGVCVSSGVTHLFSEDFQDRLVIEGLQILNPFNTSNYAAIDSLLKDC